MTREEQLQYCKSCTNRKHDINQGIICELTDQKAAFHDKCADYNTDESVEANEKIIMTPELMEKFRMEQKLLPAIIAGSVATLVGAALWCLITVSTHTQIGYMAIAIGALVGFVMRKVGKGIDPVFGIAGAIIAFLGVALGNYFSLIGLVAEDQGMNFFEVLSAIDFSIVIEVMKEDFGFIDVIFYAVAIVEGYRFSFRKIDGDTLYHIKNA